MGRLRNPASVQALCDQGLFRATSALQILSNLGDIFAEGLTGIIGAADAPKEVENSAGDSTFAGTERASRVEVFISHTWSSGRWPKYLGMCFFLNLGLALKFAIAAWALAVATMLFLEVKAPVCSREYLFPLLTELPILVFFLFFCFGQHLTGGWWAPSLWLDKLCVHQTNQSLKAQQVAALPVFVARSSRMLVLWDDTYFERLWCNMEMATFSKYATSPDKMEFLPLWLAPWLLSAILLDMLGVSIVCCMERPDDESNVKRMVDLCAPMFGGSVRARLFLHMFWEVFPNFVCYLPVALPTMLSFRRKIQGRQLMLEQMASFDLKNAKCSVETDRPLVEEQVALHFQPEQEHEVIVAGAIETAPASVETEEDAREEALERFNNYVQGPLRAACLDSIGDKQDVPLYLCYICFLPMTLYSAVNVTTAYQHCSMRYSSMGFSTPLHMLITFAICWLSTQLLVFPATFPVLLRMLNGIESATSSNAMQLFLGSLGSCLAYVYTFFCAGIIWACTCVVSQSYSPTWLLVYLLVLSLLLLQTWFFFGRRPQKCSCRCLEPVGGDATKPMLGLRCYTGEV